MPGTATGVLKRKSVFQKLTARQGEQNKRAVFSQRSDHRITEQLTGQIANLRELHRATLQKHAEDMRRYNAELGNVLTDKELLKKELRRLVHEWELHSHAALLGNRGGDGDEDQHRPHDYQPRGPPASIGDPAVQRELSILRLRALALRRALALQQENEQSAEQEKEEAHRPDADSDNDGAGFLEDLHRLEETTTRISQLTSGYRQLLHG